MCHRKTCARCAPYEEENLNALNVHKQALDQAHARLPHISEQKKIEEISSAETQQKRESTTKELEEYTLKPGDTLSRIWSHFKAPYLGSLKAAKAFKAAGISLSKLRVGEKVLLEQDLESQEIREFHKYLGSGKTLILNGDSEQGYQFRIETAEIVEKQKVANGVIRSSFAQEADRLEVPYPVVDQIVDVFASRVEFRREVQAGDEFTVMYSEREILGQQQEDSSLEPGPLAAASLSIGGRTLVAVRHVGADGVGRYFDSQGQPLDRYFLRYPLKFSRISSAFSKSRFHPVLKRRRPHNGVDFAAPRGTPVRSVADGKVVKSGWYGGSGKMVKIQHGPRFATAYLHLSKISSKLKVGKRVNRGEVIGNVGSTGYATGPHLHFSLYDHGRYVDPLKADLPVQPVDKENMISPELLKVKLETLKKHQPIVNTTIAMLENQ